MAQEDKRSDKGGGSFGDASPDETTQLKKRARRRLIGAVALALLAAIVLPMVMDHQPAPPLKDIQVRIPSPDEGAPQRLPAKPASPHKEEKPLVAEPPVQAKPEIKSEIKPELRAESKPESKPEAMTTSKANDEAWEVQLGAYQDPDRIKLLVSKLKGVGVPTYTEKIETPAGQRTRVRAGPFPSQDAAEKARTRIKIVGVDGPVARKP